MTSRRGPAIAALVTTVLLAWLAGRDPIEAQAAARLVNWLAVPALWAAAVLAGCRWRVLATAAAIAVAMALAVAGWLETGVLASLGLAGLAGGWALARRWRAVPIVALASLALIPSVALPMAGVSYPEAAGEQLGFWRDQYAERLPADASAVDRKTALASFDEVGRRSLRMVERFWPSMVLAGLVSQTVICLLAGWGVARLAMPSPPRPRLTPLAVWRAPFATVWLLIGGLALVLLTEDGLTGLVGWNLVVLAGTFVIVQGLGVQTWLIRRVLPPAGQVVFWVLGALFFAPALIGGGALIGLVDQWMDLRRLRRPPESDDET